MPNSFIAFSYGDWHSIYSNPGAQFYRVSSGNRYEINLIPTFNDTFKDDTARDGQFWLGSTHKNRPFKVDFAFCNLTQAQANQLINVFSGTRIEELVFDELPFKAYDAKVTGTPTIKFIPVDGENGLVLNGEGTINFTCYQPYAHTPRNGIWSPNDECFVTCDSRELSSYINAGYNTGEWVGAANLSNGAVSIVGGRLPAPFIMTEMAPGTFGVQGSKVNFTIPTKPEEGDVLDDSFYYSGPFTLNSDNGAVVGSNGTGIYYQGITVGKLAVGTSINEKINNNSQELPFWYY